MQIVIDIPDDFKDYIEDVLMGVGDATGILVDAVMIGKPLPKGNWIEEEVGFDGDIAYRCSNCNELFWLEEGTPKDNEYNYCPNCGADMRGDTDGNS